MVRQTVSRRGFFCYKRQSMKSSLKIGVYAMTFLVALGLTAYLTTWYIVRGQPEVQVPDLTGRDAVAALKALSDLGLNLKVRGFAFSDQIPQDHIVGQEPEAGAKIKRDREVKVTLSKGNATVRLPDLRGLPLTQAEGILDQARLLPGLISRAYDSGPEQGRDHVLEQQPAPLTPVKAGAKVNLLLSLGPRPDYLVMPDLTGQRYSLALLNLENAGLEMGTLISSAEPERPMEVVLDQEPEAGSRVAKGDRVSLTVNRPGQAQDLEYRFHLLEYAVPFGLLRREIKVRVAFGPYLIDLYEEWQQPGELIRLAPLLKGPLRCQIFEDGQETAPDGENPQG